MHDDPHKNIRSLIQSSLKENDRSRSEQENLAWQKLVYGVGSFQAIVEAKHNASKDTSERK
jgi:hypothetical protein